MLPRLRTRITHAGMVGDLVGLAVAADQIDRQADHLDASRLARATSALPPTETLRAVAAGWRHRAEETGADLATNQS
ncbi:hypothetical protein [Micromonospora sp. HM5-17]|uniref:hypothetical protein n=1 Tax=Micromonospora sp. HM5-17 TaxID=2487710 RepID=UPI000F48CE43|nr:hypothetical protein [Micromonospora sp. HM5-17]ROT29643.1 hypothetical protein EF879_18535 [Micromonospora sp. HM5-17]